MVVKYLVESEFLFHHIPRTGGTWIGAALDVINIEIESWRKCCRKGLSKKHLLLSHYRLRYRKRIKQSFAFVRHPIAYYESVWCYLMKDGKQNRDRYSIRFSWHPYISAAKIWHSDFNVWVARMLDIYPLWMTRLFELYVGPRGAEFCKYIGRTENLCNDFCSIMCLLGHEEQILLKKEKLESIEKQNIRFNRDQIEWHKELQSGVLETEKEIVNRFYGSNSNKIVFIGN